MYMNNQSADTCKWTLTMPKSWSANGYCPCCGKPAAPLPEWFKTKTSRDQSLEHFGKSRNLSYYRNVKAIDR